MVKFLDQVQWAFSRTSGKGETIIIVVSHDVFSWARFLSSRLLHTRNKCSDRLDMSNTGETPFKLTNLQPALKKPADKHPSQVPH